MTKTILTLAALASIGFAGTLASSTDASAHYRGYGYGYKSYGYSSYYVPRYYAPRHYYAPRYYAPSYSYGHSYGY